MSSVGFTMPEEPATSILDEPRIQALWPLALAFYPEAEEEGLKIGEGSLYDPVTDRGEAWDEYNEIRLRADWREWPRSYLLALLTHEAGHLAGLSHSDDPSSPMNHNFQIEAFPAALQLQAVEDTLFLTQSSYTWAQRRLSIAERKLQRADTSAGQKARWRVKRGQLQDKIATQGNTIEELEAQLGP